MHPYACNFYIKVKLYVFKFINTFINKFSHIKPFSTKY